MSRLVLAPNGPNINLPGLCEPHFYGSETLDEAAGLAACKGANSPCCVSPA